MEFSASEPVVSSANAWLEQSREALRRGDASAGRNFALSALQDAQDNKDLSLEAKAHLCLANSDRMISRVRRAQLSSQRASFLFQLCGDSAGEAEALAILACTLAILARNEEAVECALLSIKLNETIALGPALANSYNYLGVAYSYSRNFQRANAAFESSIEILEREARWVDSYLPRMNQRCNEIVDLFYARYFTGEAPDVQGLRLLRKAHKPAITSATNVSVLQGAYSNSRSILLLVDGMERCWEGNVEQATTDVDLSANIASKHEVNPSFAILELWLRAEIAWAKRGWGEAERFVGEMIDLAIQVENEHLVSIAYLLASQIFDAQGKGAQAQEQQRMVRRREQFLRNEAIVSREAVVAWQLKVRASHEDIQRMESVAKQLERLSFEDALTGLANRRKFEHNLHELLLSGLQRERPPIVAFVDVDNFKTINDSFSHNVGDQVLKRIALLLKSLVREGDLLARFAGDEFVIAFNMAESYDIEPVSERIHAAVSDFDWASIHRGLHVHVSLGLAQAELGDSVESLIHRSDLAMYAQKSLTARRA